MFRQWSRRNLSLTSQLLKGSRRWDGQSRMSRVGGQSLLAAASGNTWNHGPAASTRCHHVHAVPSMSYTARALSTAAAQNYEPQQKPFKKLMAANRGEIATRILRAGSELGCSTVGIYSREGALDSNAVCILCLLVSLFVFMFVVLFVSCC